MFPTVSRFTRVCTYDRPGTRIDGIEISTPVDQPHTVGQAVDDLHRLLAAAGEPGPYVLVPIPMADFIAALYARTYPGDVAGLVLVDAASEFVKQAATAEAFAAWDAGNRISPPVALEAVEVADATDEINAAPPMPRQPAIVLSADKPWPPAPAMQGETASGAMVTFADWLRAQDLLATSLDAKHISATRSGHNIYLFEPQLIVDAIRDVVDEVRRSAAGVTPAAELAPVAGVKRS